MMAMTSPAEPKSSVLLELRGIASFYGDIQCLRDISIQVESGSVVALVGSNGAGKTTLLNTVSGLHASRAGQVLLEGRPIQAMSAWNRVKAGIAHCPEGRRVFRDFTVDDNIRVGGHTRPASEVDDGLDRMYALFPVLKAKMHQPAGLLSGGQQQMLAIARALMSAPRLLLLDEPSMGLAPQMVEEVFDIIARLKGQGITILLVEQNAFEALPIADRAYVIETGRIALSGSGVDMMDNEQVRAAYLGI